MMAGTLELTASVIAVIDLSAKINSHCSEYYINVKNARDDIERLQREIQRFKATLEQVQSLCDSPNGAKLQASENLHNEIKDSKKQLAELEIKLEPRTRQKFMSRYGIQALAWPFESHEIEGIINKLGKCKNNISFRLQGDQAVQVLGIHQEIVLNRLRSTDDVVLDSDSEEHNTRCYQGTRVQVLRQIDTWAGDIGSECIFWLNGMAGTGKSTISRTVAQKFTDKGYLGASFFFKSGEGDRGHAGLLFTTIASQLVQRLPSLAPHVQSAVEADPAISKKGPKQQFETLVLRPLGKLSLDLQKSLRIVIVVDALDECDQEDDVRIIIRLLLYMKQITSIHLKFFLTSRPELPIRLGFKDISSRYEGLALYQIPEPIVQEDISTFLQHELALIRDSYNQSVNSNQWLPADWPGQSIIQVLAGMATPLFIFATTICRFINDRKCGQPKDLLTQVLKYKTQSQVSKLDATYVPVLKQLLVGVTASKRRDLVEEFRQVVGSIVILARPLSATSLALLLGIPQGTVDSRTDLLHSVLSIPSNPDLPIRLLHLSFRDFLVDTEKRETNPFWIDEKDIHKKLATRCLQRLSTGVYLKKDICDLRVPEKVRGDIERQTIDAHLPPDIQYACQYWVYHLEESGSIISDDDQVHNFLKCYFLCWLEALSLLGRISESISMINILIEILNPEASIKTSAFLYDAKQFSLSYLSIADLSPLQIYSAALIFAPKESVIRNAFQNYIPDWISKQPEVESSWNPLQQTLKGHGDSTTSVVFSHDSKLLASASGDRTVRIWDTATGLQRILKGHSGWVSSVVFSHNSELLASASGDRTIRIWDTATGSLQQTLKGHNSWVTSVVFSHNSKLLASASGDRTVRIWDATGSLQQTLEGHGDSVTSVAFSPDSKLLASASGDRIVRIWDVATSSLRQMLKGHKDWVTSVAFSYNSKLLASASNDRTIWIWDIATSSLQQILEGHNDRLTSVVFSHNSKLLASASSDKTIRVWDVATGSLQQVLEGHSDSANSVAFSHDSKLLASASDDRAIRIWNITHSSLQQQIYNGHSDWVTLVVFSHNSMLLASASRDRTIRIWDAATGSLQLILEGHSDWVTSVAFSPDSTLLVSASGDKTIRIWDAATGSLQHTLKGHSATSVVFLDDSKLLVSASGDRTVYIWDAATSSLQQTVEVDNCISSLPVHSADSSLIANNGRISVDRFGLPPLSTSSQEGSGKINDEGLGIRGSWVTWNGQNLLWLPPKYRGTTFDISLSGLTVAIGCQSGRVFVIGFSVPILCKS